VRNTTNNAGRKTIKSKNTNAMEIDFKSIEINKRGTKAMQFKLN